MRLRFRRLGIRHYQRSFTTNMMDLSLVPRFPGGFDNRYRLAYAAPGVIPLAEFRMSPC